jgi:hypothetical protein
MRSTNGAFCECLSSVVSHSAAENKGYKVGRPAMERSDLWRRVLLLVCRAHSSTHTRVIRMRTPPHTAPSHNAIYRVLLQRTSSHEPYFGVRATLYAISWIRRSSRMHP